MLIVWCSTGERNASQSTMTYAESTVRDSNECFYVAGESAVIYRL